MKKLVFLFSCVLALSLIACKYQAMDVDYTKTLNQAMAESDYKPGYGANKITEENFPSEITGKIVKVRVRLFHFEKQVCRNNVISEMDKAGYRPATIMELLAFAKYPEWRQNYWVAALGSTINDYCSPELFVYDDSNHHRELQLSADIDCWGTRWRFLGIHK